MLEGLDAFEQETVLRFLLHHMSMAQRVQLMHAYPIAYNKLVGSTIMKVEKIKS